MVKSYEDKIRFEREFFDKDLYDPELLIERATQVLQYVLDDFDDQVKSGLGRRPWEYVVDTINSFTRPKILSIGSGPCGLELHIAKRLTGVYEFDCLDVNDKLLNLGAEKAQLENVTLHPIVQDANELRLEREYDVIIAHASLHHLVHLEHAFDEIKRHMSSAGYFFVHEATPRNGMLLWPETKAIIDEIWKIMPTRLRVDHASEGRPVLREQYPDRDVSVDGFECIRSQDIIPLLPRYFRAEHRFHGLSLARRFVDRQFGPNYDLRLEGDKMFVDLLLATDHFLISRDVLKPEAIFYILRAI